MKGFCLAHSFLSHDRLYKLYVLRTVPTVFSVQLSNYISRCDEFVGEVNSELEPFVLYILYTQHRVSTRRRHRDSDVVVLVSTYY